MLALGLVVGGGESSPSDEHLRLLGILHDRGMTRLAEAQARAILADKQPGAPAFAKAIGVVAGIESRAATVLADAGERERAFARADKLVADFLQKHSSGTESNALRYQWAGELLLRAERLWLRSKVQPKDASLASAARQAVGDAIDRLEAIKADAGEEPSENAVQFRLGLAYLSAARLSPEGAARREWAEKSIAALAPIPTPPNSTTSAEKTLAIAEAELSLGRLNQALDQLAGAADTFPLDYRERGLVLRARIFLAAGQDENAIALLERPEGPRAPGPERLLLLIELLLERQKALRKDAADEARRLLARAVGLIELLEAEHGGYWARRGEAMLVREASPSDAEGEPKVLLRLGAALRREGKYDAAIAAFRAAKDRRARPEALGPDVDFALAETLRDAGREEEAAEAFLDFARKHPSDRRRGEALLGAALELGSDPKKLRDPARRAKYQELLERHVERVGEPGSAEARWRLGRLAERNKDPLAAIDHYRQVSAGEPRFAAALEARAGIYHDRFLLAGNRPEAERGPTLAEARADLESGLEALARSPSMPGDSYRRAAAAARFVLAGLTAKSGDPDGAAALLRQRVLNEPGLPEDLALRSWRLLLEIELDRGRTGAARTIVEEGFVGVESSLVAVLGAVLPDPDAKDAARWAAVAEAGANRLLAQPMKLTPDQRRAVSIVLGRALLLQGDAESAERLFGRLLAENPRDADAAEGLARAQFHLGRFRESLESWQRLRAGRRRGSRGWLAASYHICQCLEKLGDREEAKGMLQLLRTLYPELGGAELRERYDELERAMKTGD